MNKKLSKTLISKLCWLYYCKRTFRVWNT